MDGSKIGPESPNYYLPLFFPPKKNMAGIFFCQILSSAGVGAGRNPSQATLRLGQGNDDTFEPCGQDRPTGLSAWDFGAFIGRLREIASF